MKESNTKESNAKEPLKKKTLVMILAGLGVVIVGLVVAIVVVSVNSRKSESTVVADTTSKYLQNVTVPQTEGAEIAVKCLALTTDVGLVNCIDDKTEEILAEAEDENGQINEDAREMVEAVYSATVGVLEQGDYQAEIAELITQQTIDLSLLGDCAKAMEILDGVEKMELRDLYKAVLYGTAIGVSQTCQDPEAMAKYTEKRDSLMEVIEDAVYY